MHKTLQAILVLIGAALCRQALLPHAPGGGGGGGGGGADALPPQERGGSKSATAEAEAAFIDGSVIWIQDEADEECLGPHGFGSCGDANLWRVRYDKGNRMRFEQVDSVDTAADEPSTESGGGGGGISLVQSYCLARHFSWRGDSKIGLSKCHSLLASSLWAPSGAGGRLVNSHLGADYCVYRLGSAVRADSCDKRHGQKPVLRPVVHSLPQVGHYTIIIYIDAI
jgi:hypothetical protein